MRGTGRAWTGIALALLMAVPGGVPDARSAPGGPGTPAPPLWSAWTRFGTGLVTDLVVGGGAPGASGLLVGGRGTGALASSSLRDGRFAWTNKWEGAPRDHPGDSDTVHELVAADVTGDGTPDALAGGSQGVFAVDGRSGETVWVSQDTGSPFSRGAWELATADVDADGVTDVAFGDLIDDQVSAADGRTGALLWSYPRDGATGDLAADDLNLDGRPEVVVAGLVDLGREVHAIDGASTAGGSASALWRRDFPQEGNGRGEPRVVALGQAFAGTAFPEVVVGGSDGSFEVLAGPNGTLLSAGRVDGSVADMVLVDLDGDPDLEIVVANDLTSGDGGSVVAFESGGRPLWTVSTPGAANDVEAADLDADGRNEILVAGGWYGIPPAGQAPGFAMLLDPLQGRARAVLPAWQVALREHGSAVAVGDVFGEPTVVVGQGEEGGVVGLAPDGSLRWRFRTGGRVEHVEGADLDGDGRPEVLEAADDSAVAVHDAAGRLRWVRRVPGQGGPDVMRVAAGDLGPTPGREVVAGTWEFDLTGPPGRIHGWTASGRLLWSADAAGAVNGLAVADLDGDGEDDAVGVTSVAGSALRLDGDGGVVWEAAVDTGSYATLALADATGDGVLDALVGRKSIVDGTVYALDGVDGSEVWRRTIPAGVNWLATSDRVPGAVAVGDLAGGVHGLDAATGRPVWTHDGGWSSWDGEWSADANGDGVPDVASAHEDGFARMLDGTTGEPIWAAPTDGQAGLTITTVPAGAATWVALGTYGPAPITPAFVYAFDARTGGRLGRSPVGSMVLSLTAADLHPAPGHELLAGAGWQVHAFGRP